MLQTSNREMDVRLVGLTHAVGSDLRASGKVSSVSWFAGVKVGAGADEADARGQRSLCRGM